MDGRPNRRNRAAFSNFSGVVCALPYNLDTSLSKSYLCSWSQLPPIICEMLSWKAQWAKSRWLVYRAELFDSRLMLTQDLKLTEVLIFLVYKFFASHFFV